MVHKHVKHIINEVDSYFQIDSRLILNGDGSGAVVNALDFEPIHSRLQWFTRKEDDLYLEEWIAAIELAGGVVAFVEMPTDEWKNMKENGIEAVYQEPIDMDALHDAVDKRPYTNFPEVHNS
jgi:hypothetical protein